MIRVAIYAVAATAIVSGCQSPYRPAPDIELVTIDGAEFSMKAHGGDVVLLNFWATWCGPCVAEMPELDRIQRDYQSQGLSVVGVSIDVVGVDSVRQFVIDRQIDYPIIHDTGAAQTAYGELVAVPTTVLIDRRGRIREVIVGAFVPRVLRASVESLLREH